MILFYRKIPIFVSVFLLFFVPFFAFAEEDITPLEKDAVLIKELKSIVLLGSADEKVPEDKKSVYGIYWAGLEIPSSVAFIEKLKPFINKPVTIATLQEIKLTVIRLFRERGMSLVAVSIPPDQNLSAGQVQLIVLVAKLGKIEVKDARNFSDENIAKQIRIKPGEVIRTKRVMNDLAWINQNPFLDVSVEYEPGKEQGLTDLVLRVKDKRPFRAFAGYENTDNNVAGHSRLFAGINWGNVFNLDHQINYQFLVAPNPRRWHAHTASYIAPLPWRHIFKFFGFYSSTRPKIWDNEFDMAGKSWQLSGRYIIPYMTYQGFRHNFIFGYDFKQTDNFFNFFDTELHPTNIDISQFLIGYEGMFDDSYGNTSVAANLYMSPGKMTHYNRNRFFRQERPGGRADYIYFRGNLDRVFHMPYDFSWVLSGVMQVSGAQLMPMEELSIGGYASVRGYKENEIIGDYGWIIKNEIRSPSKGFIKRKGKIIDSGQLLAFLDYGRALEIDPNILNRKSSWLASIGPGVRYHIKDNVQLRCDYGWQLRSVFIDKKRTGKVHLEVIIAY